MTPTRNDSMKLSSQRLSLLNRIYARCNTGSSRKWWWLLISRTVWSTIIWSQVWALRHSHHIDLCGGWKWSIEDNFRCSHNTTIRVLLCRSENFETLQRYWSCSWCPKCLILSLKKYIPSRSSQFVELQKTFVFAACSGWFCRINYGGSLAVRTILWGSEVFNCKIWSPKPASSDSCQDDS